jgi:hypothetical protein
MLSRHLYQDQGQSGFQVSINGMVLSGFCIQDITCMRPILMLLGMLAIGVTQAVVEFGSEVIGGILAITDLASVDTVDSQAGTKLASPLMGAFQVAVALESAIMEAFQAATMRQSSVMGVFQEVVEQRLPVMETFRQAVREHVVINMVNPSELTAELLFYAIYRRS